MTLDYLRSAEWIEGCSTSLTIDNIPVRLVGVALEVLREAGFIVEVNVAPPAESDDE